MEDVFRDVQAWLFADNPYAYPAVTYFDYHTMHLESCIMTIKPMVGVPWHREFDDSEEPRMVSSFDEEFKHTASFAELERCHFGFYNELHDFISNSENKNLAMLATRPHPSEFSQHCIRIMYRLDEDFPVSEDGKPLQYVYGVFDFTKKPFVGESEEN
jgi:hypothetical protein